MPTAIIRSGLLLLVVASYCFGANLMLSADGFSSSLKVRTQINETINVVNQDSGPLQLNCASSSETSSLIITRLQYSRIRSSSSEQSLCASREAQIQEVSLNAIEQIRRSCSMKSSCKFTMESILSTSGMHNVDALLLPCFRATDWYVAHVCERRSFIFGSECVEKSSITATSPFQLPVAQNYAFLLSTGYPMWSTAGKECYWELQQPRGHSLYVSIDDMDLKGSGFSLSLRKKTASDWEQVFLSDSLTSVDSTFVSWKLPADANSSVIQVAIKRNTSPAAGKTSQVRVPRGFLIYYQVQHQCVIPDWLEASWRSMKIMWPPVLTSSRLVISCEADHVFVGTTLRMKVAQCVNNSWSPSPTTLVAGGCQAVDSPGGMQQDLSKSTILGIIFGSLAAFGVVILAITLIASKRKYHTFFPCCRSHKKTRLPAANQPKYTPSSASNTSYLVGAGVSRVESDRSAVTEYTLVPNPYAPVTQSIGSGSSALAVQTLYAPVLKSMASSTSSNSAPSSQYAPRSSVFTDSYNDGSLGNGNNHAISSAGIHSPPLKEESVDGSEGSDEVLYEDPVHLLPVKNSDNFPLPSPLPDHRSAFTPYRPKVHRHDLDAEDFDDQAPLNPPPPPPVSKSKTNYDVVAISPESKGYESYGSDEEYENPRQLLDDAPDTDPPPPPIVAANFKQPKVFKDDNRPPIPTKPKPPAVLAARAKKEKDRARQSHDYIDFSNNSENNSNAARMRPGVRESAI